MMNNSEIEDLKQKHASEIESLQKLCISFKNDAEKERAKVQSLLEGIFMSCWSVGPFILFNFGFGPYSIGFVSLFFALFIYWILKRNMVDR